MNYRVTHTYVIDRHNYPQPHREAVKVLNKLLIELDEEKFQILSVTPHSTDLRLLPDKYIVIATKQTESPLDSQVAIY